MKGGLRRRILPVLVLAALVPTLAVGVSAVRRSRHAVREQVLSGHLALIRVLGASLDEKLQTGRRALDLAAQTWADERIAEQVDDEIARKRSGRLLSRVRRHIPILARLAVVDVYGKHLLGDAVQAEADIGAHSFGGYIGDIIVDGGGFRVRAVSQARSRTGELVGAFVAELDLEFIAETLASARLGPGARLYVVDGDGRLVAQSDDAVLPTTTTLRATHPAVARALSSATEGVLEQDGVVAAYRNLSSFQSLRGVRWAIVHEQPASQAYALARSTAADTALVGLLALVAVLGCGVLLASRITRPLRALADSADAIADGQAVRIPALRDPGEVGHLARRFQDMAVRLEEREELREALAREHRLAAIGTMAAGVAHEVGNPLTTILGYAKLLLEDRPESDPDRRALLFIAEEAERLKALSENMLDYARAEPEGAAPRFAEVNPLIQRTAELMGPTLRKQGVTIALELESQLPAVRVGSYGLQQVLVNLVANAAQAMEAGGLITVWSRYVGGSVELVVEDQGPGVSEELRQKIFTPFYTTRGHGKGTGLGLAVCRHLVAGFGGTIDVGPAPAGGAAFRVVLPTLDSEVRT